MAYNPDIVHKLIEDRHTRCHDLFLTMLYTDQYSSSPFGFSKYMGFMVQRTELIVQVYGTGVLSSGGSIGRWDDYILLEDTIRI